MQRIFLSWDEPFLPQASAWLRTTSSDPNDLSDTVVVLPGRRAGRNLLRNLMADAGEDALHPPIITTPGRALSAIFDTVEPAPEAVQSLAWTRAVASLSPSLRDKLLPWPPAPGQLLRWTALGQLFAELATELQLSEHSMADVAQMADDDAARWQALEQAQAAAHELLERAGWPSPNNPWSEVGAAERRRGVRRVVFMALVDLDAQLARVAVASGAACTTLIFAPEELRDAFDEHGRPDRKAWSGRPLPLAADQLVVAEDAAGQTNALLQGLAELPSGAAVSVGVVDPTLADTIAPRLTAAGLPAQSAAGRPGTAGSLPLLLQAIAGLLRARSFDALAALIRHPRMETWIADRHDDALDHFDRFHREHLPYRLDRLTGSSESAQVVRAVRDDLHKLIAPMRAGHQSLAHWSSSVRDVLEAIYAESELGDTGGDNESVRHEAEQLVRLRELWAVLSEVKEPLDTICGGADALEWMARQISHESLAPAVLDGNLELLGWLELPLDESPHLFISGMNEEWVPGRSTTHPFLPDSLRTKLAIPDDRARFARDAYSMHALLHSRRVHRITCGRRSHTGDPLRPSRLLLMTEIADLAPRVLRFLDVDDARTHAPSWGQSEPRASSLDVQPPANAPMTVSRLAITAFGQYLACPYRYYLRNVRNLTSRNDHHRELDALGFGRLLHRVLEMFGRSPVRDEVNAQRIEEFLLEALDQEVAQRHGAATRPAVLLQVEHMRRRLLAFARWQAERRRQGWRIDAVEREWPAQHSRLDVDDAPVTLAGRIDRIDVHERSSAVAVIDYKTGDTSATPDRRHRHKEQWIDLQLPLYHHLVSGDLRRRKKHAVLELAYLTLPRETETVDYLVAPWSNHELASAMDAARDVVRNLRRGAFWPPSESPGPWDEYRSLVPALEAEAR